MLSVTVEFLQQNNGLLLAVLSQETQATSTIGGIVTVVDTLIEHHNYSPPATLVGNVYDWTEEIRIEPAITIQTTVQEIRNGAPVTLFSSERSGTARVNSVVIPDINLPVGSFSNLGRLEFEFLEDGNPSTSRQAPGIAPAEFSIVFAKGYGPVTIDFGPAIPLMELTNSNALEFHDDGDGMPNGWETLHNLDPSDPADARGNPDGDRLSNLQEYKAGRNPHNPDNDLDVFEAKEGWNLISAPRDAHNPTPALLFDCKLSGAIWHWEDGRFQTLPLLQNLWVGLSAISLKTI